MADEQAVKAEEQAPDATAQGEQKPNKKKKINRLSLDDINKKIDALMQVNQNNSKYHQHLLQRRNELQA